MTGQGQIDLAAEISASVTVHRNIQQTIVVVPEDRLRLCLMEHRDCLSGRRDWLTPLSLLVALITTLVAADFNKTLVFAPNVWEAMYVIASLLSGIWLIRALYRSWSVRNAISLDSLVVRIKSRSLDMLPQATEHQPAGA